MSYDIAARFQQALDPSALITLPACLHALIAAIDDCRNAGKPQDVDPAVLLLARHLGSVAERAGASTMQLRRDCMDAVAELRRRPALIALANKGVGYDAPAKKLFHTDGRKALKRLADALGLLPEGFTVRSNLSGIAVSGEIMLQTDEIYVELSLGALGPGHEILFRRVNGRGGDRNHWDSVHELVQPGRSPPAFDANFISRHWRRNPTGCSPDGDKPCRSSSRAPACRADVPNMNIAPSRSPKGCRSNARRSPPPFEAPNPPGTFRASGSRN